jgi:hypothetical protein
MFFVYKPTKYSYNFLHVFYVTIRSPNYTTICSSMLGPSTGFGILILNYRSGGPDPHEKKKDSAIWHGSDSPFEKTLSSPEFSDKIE